MKYVMINVIKDRHIKVLDYFLSNDNISRAIRNNVKVIKKR